MKKKLSIPLLIILVIIGSAIYRNFNFETMKFEKFWLGILYIFTFLLTLFLMIYPDKKNLQK
jgi:hypothetical protein